MRAAETVPTTCTEASPRESSSRQRKRRWLFSLTLMGAAAAPEWLETRTAHAQEPAPPVIVTEPAPPPPAPAMMPAAPPPYPDGAVVTGPIAPEPQVQAHAPQEEPALAEPKPLEEPKDEKPSILAPKLKIGIGVRTGLNMSLNNPSNDVKVSLDDGIGDQMLIRPYFSGELTKNIGVVANFQITENGKNVGFTVMDAIAQVKFANEFQVWIGQHIPANDRTNFSGPFFHNGWQFPITVPSFPFDAAARSRGVTAWGLIAGGIIKYHASWVDLAKGRSVQNSRLAARVTINLLDPENYYYASGTYFGAQNTLAIGGVVQYQKGIGGHGYEDGISGAPPPDLNKDGKIDNDFLGGAVDLLAEKNFGKLGTWTYEAGYWNFNGSGKDYVVNQGTVTNGIGFTGPQPGQSFTMMFSWLTPQKVGIGQIQPNFRVQWADYNASSNFKTYDAGISYVIDGFNHRWALNYRHQDTPGGKDDSIQLGAQFQL
ncbi:MAG: putative secreted protein [Myxococcaceae bacterium]|nr:putative secreted protein [Myxococcaceae bacterium]